MERYRIPPFEMDRIVRVVRREEAQDGMVFHLARADGQPEPFASAHVSNGGEPDALLLMFDVPVFACHGLPIGRGGFVPARNNDGIWFAYLG